MRTGIVSGIEIPVQIEYGDEFVPDFYHLTCPCRNLMNTANSEEFSYHPLSTSNLLFRQRLL